MGTTYLNYSGSVGNYTIGLGMLKPPQFAFTVEYHRNAVEGEFAICLLFFYLFVKRANDN